MEGTFQDLLRIKETAGCSKHHIQIGFVCTYIPMIKFNSYITHNKTSTTTTNRKYKTILTVYCNIAKVLNLGVISKLP